ncbi:uncharacterized protein LOC130010273 [Patella vulgata]|uniref:uncharacterized protein LOC130010273 n=1 Tax=Patella vulgata TaxID=6465 RepID=UPI00217FC0F6|nr:uncharacterized protein LOC130010273 [Patella vulgata]
MFRKLRRRFRRKPNQTEQTSPRSLCNAACHRSLMQGGFPAFKIEFKKLLRLYQPDNITDNRFIRTVVYACEHTYQTQNFDDFKWLVLKINNLDGLMKLFHELCELGITVYCEYILSIYSQFQYRDISDVVYYAVESCDDVCILYFVCELSINKPELGIDINKRSGADNFTPFMKTIKNNKYKHCLVLIEYGCEVKLLRENEKPIFSWEELFPCFFGPNLNYQQRFEKAGVRYLQMFIDSGTDLGIGDINGNTMLELALEKQVLGLAIFLLRNNFPITDKCFVILNKYYLPKKTEDYNGGKYIEFQKLYIIYLVSLFSLKLNFVNGLDAVLCCTYRSVHSIIGMDRFIEEFNSLPSLFSSMTLKERCRLKRRSTLGVRVNFEAPMEKLELPRCLLEYILNNGWDDLSKRLKTRKMVF